MTAFIQPALEAITAFCATNVDDLFILMLFFSRLDESLRAWHVVCGQFLGIAGLVSVSLLSVLGRMALPEGLIGLLGLFPVSIGLSQLAETFDTSTHRPDEADDNHWAPWMAGLLGVTALTIANGSDNISVYMALFANSDPLRLRVFPLVFALLTGFWCLLAWWLSQTSVLTQLLRRLQRDLTPLLLIGIGVLVLHDNHILRHPAQASVAVACLGVMVASLIQQLRLLLRTRRLSGMPQP